MEDTYPGMWLRWFLNQCVGVGWYSDWGYSLDGGSDNPNWSRARNALKKIEAGDHIVVSLKNHRVGRIGEVTGKAVGDGDWEPLVPRSASMPDGEMGRRILVRWDLVCRPDNQDRVIALPPHARFTPGELRPTISEIHSISLCELKKEMSNPLNR
jgi:hypothetical protein